MEHLPAAKLAAYIDGTLSESERFLVEAHLAECDSCRAETVDAVRAVRSAPLHKRRVLSVVGTAAAAAAILLLVLIPRSVSDREGSDIERVLGDHSAGIAVVRPAMGAVVHPDSVILEWRAEDQASYRVTVLDERGTRLWEGSTSEPRVRMFAGVELPVGRLVYWYVDALRADGSSKSSGLQSFTTRGL